MMESDVSDGQDHAYIVEDVFVVDAKKDASMLLEV